MASRGSSDFIETLRNKAMRFSWPGEVVFLSLTLIAWGSRGPDIPIKNFFVFFLRWAADPITALFPLAGLITAGLYWWLGKQRTGPLMPVQ
jgi:hypothetical protein